MDSFHLRNKMPNNLNFKKYKSLVTWLENLTDDELAFIDSFIENVEIELDEMVLEHSNFKESFDIIERIKKL